MGLTLQNLRDNVRMTLGVDDIDYDDTVVDGWINKSYWELDAKFPFKEKQADGSFVTVAGTYEYTLSPSDFESLVTVSIMSDDGLSSASETSANLDRMTLDWWNQRYSTDTNKQDKPTHYFRNESQSLILFPTPDDIYTINFRYLKQLSDLVSSSEQPNFPRSWHEIVELGAEWRGFKAIGDTKRMTDSRNAQVAMVGSSVPIEAKEEFDSHRAGVQVPSREY